jgi:phosphatidylglycerophosphate synthase
MTAAAAVGLWRRARGELARMTKPREIEGVFDTYLIRPLGFLFVQLLRRTAVTPNMVSVASMIVGLGVGLSYLLWYRQPAGAWLGLAFMVLHSGLDAADGQLARATGRTSPLGRLIDGLCDNVTFVSIYVCLVLAHALAGGSHPFLVLLLACVAGASHSTHCALTEFERMLFLNYVLGTHDTVAEQPEVLRRAGRPARWPQRVLRRLQINYSVQQRAFLRSSDTLERLWASAVAERPELRSWFAGRYRQASERMLRFWPLLGPNSHKVALVCTAFLAALLPSLAPLGMVLYLLYDALVLNAVMVVLILVQRRIDRRLAGELTAQLSAPSREPGVAAR